MAGVSNTAAIGSRSINHRSFDNYKPFCQNITVEIQQSGVEAYRKLLASFLVLLFISFYVFNWWKFKALEAFIEPIAFRENVACGSRVGHLSVTHYTHVDSGAVQGFFRIAIRTSQFRERNRPSFSRSNGKCNQEVDQPVNCSVHQRTRFLLFTYALIQCRIDHHWPANTCFMTLVCVKVEKSFRDRRHERAGF